MSDRRREVVRMIIADAEADAAKLEGRPFDAPNVAEVFGQILAAVHGLGRIVESLLDQVGEQ